jgi:hypothetical protein
VFTDSGAVFTGRLRAAGRVALEVTLHARGVVLSHSRPYPRRALRQGRTLPPDPEQLAGAPATGQDHRAQLQAHLDVFRGYYITVRGPSYFDVITRS